MAKDLIHNAVKNALIKDGWTITDDPYKIKYEEFELFADLAAERLPIAAQKNGQQIVVEIKMFAERSFVRALQQAMGQYEMYRGFIELTDPTRKLYLAVSHRTYNTFFRQKAVKVIIQRNQLNLLVVNIKQEEVVKWIN